MTTHQTIGNQKQWALLRYRDGSFRIVVDYGDYAWNSPIYEVIDYFVSHAEARDARRRLEVLGSAPNS